MLKKTQGNSEWADLQQRRRGKSHTRMHWVYKEVEFYSVSIDTKEGDIVYYMSLSSHPYVMAVRIQI